MAGVGRAAWRRLGGGRPVTLLNRNQAHTRGQGYPVVEEPLTRFQTQAAQETPFPPSNSPHLHLLEFQGREQHPGAGTQNRPRISHSFFHQHHPSGRGLILPTPQRPFVTGAVSCAVAERDNEGSAGSSTSIRGTSAGAQSKGGRKRPYTKARAAEAREGNGQFAVLLDSRELLTPAKQPLRVPSLALANALAAEWEWQEGVKLRPYTMPLMKLTATALDQIPRDRPKVIDSLVDFFDTDVILIRHPGPEDDPAGSQASESSLGGWGSSNVESLTTLGASFSRHQRQLYERQQELWDPLLRKLRSELGIGAEPCSACLPPPQPSAAVSTLRQFLVGLDDWNLTAVDFLASTTRSVSIAVLLSKGVIDVDAAMSAARLEEDFQIASAGFVEGGHDIDLADIRVKLLAPVVFLKLLHLRGA